MPRRAVLGSFGGCVGVIWGLCWGHLGVSWKPTVSILRPTGAVSVHFELFWGLLCHLLIFRVNCGASRIHSERFGGHSHVSGAIPGPFVSVWAHLTSAWVTLRRFWSIRSDVGALWGKFLCVVRLFGTISMMRRGRGWDGSESVGKAVARSELWATIFSCVQSGRGCCWMEVCSATARGSRALLLLCPGS